MPEVSKPREMSRQELVDGFRGIGLKALDKVMVHSSIKAIGRTEGGPEGVVQALQEVLTPRGTLMMPSFNHARPWQERGKGFYDPTRTPTWNGAIPDAFWRMPGVLRSLDPTHPIACWGADAQRYTQFHHRTLTMGSDSPLGMLARDGGLGVMLGVGYKPNTYHHVVEMMIGSPCLGLRTEAYPVHLAGGRVVMGRTWGWRSSPCPITDRQLYPGRMAAYERRGTLGICPTIVFKFSDAWEVISEALREGMEGFPPCSRCPIRPRTSAFAVESDWDAANGCLKSDSAAWTY